MHNIAMLVSNDLHLNMARIRNKLFYVQRPITKGGLSLGSCRCKNALELLRSLYQPHTAPPSSGSGLENHRQANLFNSLSCFLDRIYTLRPRQSRNTIFLCQPPGPNFISHLSDLLGFRTHKNNAITFAALSQFSRLG